MAKNERSIRFEECSKGKKLKVTGPRSKKVGGLVDRKSKHSRP